MLRRLVEAETWLRSGCFVLWTVVPILSSAPRPNRRRRLLVPRTVGNLHDNRQTLCCLEAGRGCGLWFCNDGR